MRETTAGHEHDMSAPGPGSPRDTVPRLAIVLPCYNEEAMLPYTFAELLPYLERLIAEKQVAENSFLYFVDDGSRDHTWALIAAQHAARPQRIKGLKLARNMGHQHALLAGLLTVKPQVDCTISLDADLQDDIAAIGPMVSAYQKGHEIVYGIRQDRSSDSLFKRQTALAFYRVMRCLGVDIVVNHADCRLLGRRALEALGTFGERNIFLRALVPLLGFRHTSVTYERKPRHAGESKYTLRKMLSLAWNGMTSFSVVPLRLVLTAGVVICAGSMAASAWSVIAWLRNVTVPGWTSTMLPIYFLGGVQLLAIGILGEYLGKIYMEVKRRPRFITEEELT